MVRVELVARPPYGNSPVFGFEFATSRFRDIQDHLGAGLQDPVDEPDGTRRGRMNVRSLGSASAPPMAWLAGVRSRIDRLNTLRTALAAALTIGEHDAGVTIVDATAEIAAIKQELGEVYRNLYEVLDRGGTYVLPTTPTTALPELPATPAASVSYSGVHHLFEAVGLGHRPLPPRAVEVLAVDAGAGWFALIESPEPLDWTRLNVERADTGATLPIVWSSDGTRAFLFDVGPTGLFAADPLSLRWRFHCGGEEAPDLEPLYRNGELSAFESIVWDVPPAGGPR
jgi:hypothetical protein